MKNISAILVSTIILASPAIAEGWKEMLPQLSNVNYSTRVNAQKVIIAKVKLFSTKDTLEGAMSTLLVKYSHSDDPEMKERLIKIMKSIADPYRASLGAPAIGMMIEASRAQMNNKNSAFVFISEVKQGSPADKAGIKKNDRIYTIANYDLRKDFSITDTKFGEILDQYAPGETLQLGIFRDNAIITAEVTLGKRNVVQKSLFSKLLPQSKKHMEVDAPQPIAGLKHPLSLPERHDDGSFFARWFKRQQKQ